MANDTEYGLAAYFYARDVGRIFRIMEGLEYGIIGINEGIISTEVAPFGGMKTAGIGREGSKYGIEGFLEIKYAAIGGLDTHEHPLHDETRMIPRYARETMTAIWSPETKYRIWFEIEAHAADAMAELGIIPKEAARVIWEKGRNAKFDAERIDEIEHEVKHDVIAFLTHLAEFVGPDARFVHQGMTSSDVLDTTLAVQLSRASDILIADIDGLLAALKRRAFEYKLTPTIGRSHGIHAEPTTFGIKLAGFYAEFSRARGRLLAAKSEIATCAISARSAPLPMSARRSKPMSPGNWG